MFGARRRLTALGAVVLACAALAVLVTSWQEPSDPAPSVAEEPVDPTAKGPPEPEAASPARSEVDADRMAAPGEMATETVPLGGIRARVVDSSRQPVPGATVRLQLGGVLFLRTNTEHPALAEESLSPRETDSEGRFLFDRVPAGGGYTIFIDSGRHPVIPWRNVTVPAGEVHDLGEYVLVDGASIAGRTVDRQGRPVPGVRLSGPGDRVATSGLDGRFLLQGLPAGNVTMHIAREGMAPEPPAYRRFDVVSGQHVKDVEVVLLEAFTVRGRVTSDDGSPLERAEVLVFVGVGQTFHCVAAVETDGDGRYACDAIPHGHELQVEAARAGYQTRKRNSIAADTERVDIVLRKAAVIDVLALDAESGAAVEVEDVDLYRYYGQEENPFPSDLFRDHPDSVRVGPGRYAVPIAENGRYQVVLKARGFLEAATERVDVAGSGSIGPLAVRLTRGSALAGRVILKQDGQPVAGAVVTLFHARPSNEISHLDVYGVDVEQVESEGPNVATDGEGRFVFENIEHQGYSLRVEKHGQPAVHVGDLGFLPGTGEEVVVQVPAPSAVRGSVTGKDGLPAAGVPVVAWRWDGYHAPDDTGADGTYRIFPLAAGLYRVAAGEPGNHSFSRNTVFLAGDSEVKHARPEEFDVHVVEGKETVVDLDLRVTGHASVTGTVLVRGVPAPGYRVQIELPSDATDRTGSFFLPESTTNERGEFLLDDLTPGRYLIEVNRDGQGILELARREVNLQADVPERQDFLLEPARIGGRVVDRSGHVVAGVVVQVSRKPTAADLRNCWQKVTTDAAGRFDCDTVPEGSYKIDAHDRTGTARQLEIGVGARESVEVELTLEPSGSVRLHVEPAELQLDSLSVSFSESNSDSYRFAPYSSQQNDGSILLGGISPGLVTLRVRTHREPRLTASAAVEVKAGEEVEVRVTLVEE